MGFKHRIHFFKAFYHVIHRGNNRQNIFFCDDDRTKFYQYIADAISSYDFKVHLFCLMSNHIHLVIEVGHVPLAKIMQNISSRYARYLNKKYDRKGHLFESRYNAIMIQNERYLLELCYYIHMNPVKSGLVTNLSQYRWSSHHAYCSHEKISWLTTDIIFRLIKKHLCSKINAKEIPQEQILLHFINCHNPDNDYAGDGTPTFCKVSENGDLIIGDVVNEHNQHIVHNKFANLPLKNIAMIICNYLNVDLEDLTSSSLKRRLVLARSMIVYFAHYRANFLLIDIANFLDRNAQSISRTTHNTLKIAQSSPKVQQVIHALEQKFCD